MRISWWDQPDPHFWPNIEISNCPGWNPQEDLAILYLSMALSVSEVGAPKCFLVVWALLEGFGVTLSWMMVEIMLVGWSWMALGYSITLCCLDYVGWFCTGCIFPWHQVIVRSRFVGHWGICSDPRVFPKSGQGDKLLQSFWQIQNTSLLSWNRFISTP